MALGAIEDAEALVFCSGQAASMALMLSLTEGRERLVMAADGYYSTRRLAGRRPNGVQPIHVDLLDVPAVERELARPAVLWVETPTNPLLRVANLARLAEVAAGAPMVVDNTLATGPSSSRSPGVPPAHLSLIALDLALSLRLYPPPRRWRGSARIRH